MDIRVHTRFAIGETVFVETAEEARFGVVKGICYYVNGDLKDDGMDVKERLYYNVLVGDKTIKVLGNAVTRREA